MDDTYTGFKGWVYCAIVVLSAGVISLSYFQRLRSSNEIPSRGFVLPGLPHYSWSEHRFTLVVVMQHGCGFCAQSLPFYERIISMERRGEIHGHLLVLFPNNAFVPRGDVPNNADNDQVYSNARIDGVTATPTVLVVDSAGEIERVWQGALARKEEEAIVALVR